MPALHASALVVVLPILPSMADWYVDLNAPGCATGNGSQAAPFCDINDALAVAASGDTIHIAPGTYVELLDLTSDVTLDGTNGAAVTIVDANAQGRVVYVRSGVTATIEGLTIRNGLLVDSVGSVLVEGGGILNEGTLSVRDSVVAHNELQATSQGRGAGIASRGDLTLVGSSVSDNDLRATTFSFGGLRGAGVSVEGTAEILSCEIADNTHWGHGLGGGIDVIPTSTLVLKNSTVSGNGFTSTGAGFGGGIAAFQAAGVRIERSTIRGNVGEYGGGIGASGGALTMLGSTVSNNESDWTSVYAYEVELLIRNSTISGDDLPGVPHETGLVTYAYYDADVTLENVTIFGNDFNGWDHTSVYPGYTLPTVRNSIIAGNGGTDASTDIESLGFNLIGRASPLSNWVNGVNGDLVGTFMNPVDPLLAPLADNGGPTETHALLPMSPAIDAGDPVTFEPTDQRGLPRPAGFADIGAFERDPGGPIPDCPPVANSTGAAGAIASSGTTSLAANDFVIEASSLPQSAFGFFLTSRDFGSVLPGNSVGRLCLSGAIGRFVGPGQILDSGAAGAFALPLDLGQHPTPTGLVPVQPGETWFFQAWHRDAVMGMPTSNFTAGMAATFR